jgi:ABC-2 type transport system permease protein
MQTIISIAIKDIRLLLRDRVAAFFVLGFPILMGLFFGLLMGYGGPRGGAKMQLAAVDQDDSSYSRKLIQSLKDNKNLQVELTEQSEARESVQAGRRVAMVVIPEGFGKTAGIFWESQVALQVGVDPSRSAEGAMLEGFLMEAVGGLVGQRFNNPDEMLARTTDSIDTALASPELSESRREALQDFKDDYSGMMNSFQRMQDNPLDDQNPGDDSSASGPGFQLAKIDRIDVTREIDPKSVEGQVRKLRSRWDISFPQAMLWGVLGCVAGFAVSLAQEREAGTLLRLQVAPIRSGHVLCGKALACFLSTLAVIALMTLIGYLIGMRPLSFSKLAVASLSVALCFVGIMMTLATVGRTVQSVSGIGWATNMIMAMLGGCMIPVLFMPQWIAKIGFFSPVRWAIQSLEGAIWRDFDWFQLAITCSVLIGTGVMGLGVGVWNSQKGS